MKQYPSRSEQLAAEIAKRETKIGNIKDDRSRSMERDVISVLKARLARGKA